MKKNTISYDDLDIEIKKYLTEDEMNEVKRAYLYAESKHKDQYRRTGEEFIIHPLFVAYILTSIKADYKTLMAALLHDVVEDTDTDLKDIEKSFGEEVMNLVDGVTKIRKNESSYPFENEQEHVSLNKHLACPSSIGSAGIVSSTTLPPPPPTPVDT